MEHEITAQQVVNAVPHLRQLASQPIPVKTALDLREIRRDFEEKAEDVDEERQKILKRHAEHDENDQIVSERGQVQFKDEEAESAAMSELNDLFGAEVELEYEPISIEKFGDVEISEAGLSLLLDIDLLETS